MYSLKIESEAENFLNLVFHLDERTMIRRNSVVANKIYDTNIVLFNKIFKGTTYSSGKLYRFQVGQEKTHRNRLGVKTFSSSKSKRELLLSFGFHNNQAVKQTRYDFGDNQIYDVRASDVKKSKNGNIISSKNVTHDDIREASPIANVHEYRFFSREHIKTLIFDDYKSVRDSTATVSYELEIYYSDDYRSYVNKIVDGLEKSVIFVTKYISTIIATSAYNKDKNEWKKSFQKSILSNLGLDPEVSSFSLKKQDRTILDSSEFADVVNTMILGLNLVGKRTSQKKRSKALMTLLPINSSLDGIQKLLSNLQALLDEVIRTYSFSMSLVGEKSKMSNQRGKRTGAKRLVFTTKETYKVQSVNKIGYNLISNQEPSSIPLVTPSFLRKRILHERRKYYPNLNKVSTVKTLNGKEKSHFLENSGFSSFITPVGIKVGGEVRSLSKGIVGVDPIFIKNFRLLKTLQAKHKRENNLMPLYSSFRKNLANSLFGFNITISKALKSNLQMKKFKEDSDFIDSAEFLGDYSYFFTDLESKLSLSSEQKARMSEKQQQRRDRNFKIMSDILPMKFLETKKISTAEQFNISKISSVPFKSTTKGNFNFRKVPPQIKSFMIPGSFNAGSSVAFKTDPFKNKDSRAVLQETQLNIFNLKVLKGFRKILDGSYEFDSPIFSDLSQEDLDFPTSQMIVVDKYSNDSLGFSQELYVPNVFDRLFILRRGQSQTRQAISQEIDLNQQTSATPAQANQVLNEPLDVYSPKFSSSNVIVQDKNKSGFLSVLRAFEGSMETQQVNPVEPNSTGGPTSFGGGGSTGGGGY